MMTYHSDVSKPTTVGFHPGNSTRCKFGLEWGWANDFARFITLGLKVTVHLQTFDCCLVSGSADTLQSRSFPVWIHTVTIDMDISLSHVSKEIVLSNLCPDLLNPSVRPDFFNGLVFLMAFPIFQENMTANLIGFWNKLLDRLL